MQKQTHKYILSMLIATLLVLSMFPLVVPVQAGVLTLTTPAADQQVEVGEEVWVNGTAEIGELIKVYWETEIAGNLLGEEYAIGGDFEILVVIPEALPGYHYILLRPTGTISSRRLEVIPAITLTPDTGLPGKTVTVDGAGFEAEEDITLRLWNDTTWDMTLTTSPATVTTSTEGSFTCTFDIPSNATDYGTYNVEAKDETGNYDTETLSIGATIVIDVAEGPSGTVVGIDGEGFTGTTGTAVNVSVGGVWAFEVDDIETTGDGTFSGEFIVPTLDVIDDPYSVIASDEGGISSGGVDFDLTGTSSITLDPVSGVPLSTVAIEGVNFTQIANVEVNVTFDTLLPPAPKNVTIAKTFTTNATGGFSGTFTVPDHPDLPIRPEKYTIIVMDENGLYAKEDFKIVRTRAFVDPEEGSAGGLIEVWVEGLTGGSDYNVTIDGDLMLDGPGAWDFAEGTLDGDGQFQSTDKWISLYAPTLPVDVATVMVMDTEGVSASAAFDVTETTTFVLTPSSGPPDYNITIEADNYIASAGKDITITIYNLTTDGEVDWDDNLFALCPGDRKAAADGHTIVGNNPQTNATGNFEGSFLVPDLNLGDYKINATDEEGLGVWMIDFSIVEVTVEVSTVRTIYAQGEDVTFKIRSTFPSGGSIELMDADEFNTTIEVLAGETPTGHYQLIGDWYFAYPKVKTYSDSPLGTWDWTADIGGTVRHGSFELAESTTGVVLIQRINELEEDLAQLSDAVDALGSSVGGVSTDIGTVEGYVDELESDLAAVSTLVSGISASATAAETAATAARTAAEQANATASGISMAVYGSMALSLIAALAAIAAVLTLQRKVAG